MSIKRKLQEFSEDYLMFVESENVMNKLSEMFETNKIKFDMKNNKIVNLTKNPFQELRKKNNDMNYESSIIVNSKSNKNYRRKLDYTFTYSYITQKMLNQIEIIEIICLEKLKYNLLQISTYMYLMILDNNDISNCIFSFLSNDKNYYKKMCDEFCIIHKIELYKNKVKYIDNKLLKNTVDIYYKYLMYITKI